MLHILQKLKQTKKPTPLERDANIYTLNITL